MPSRQQEQALPGSRFHPTRLRRWIDSKFGKQHYVLLAGRGERTKTLLQVLRRSAPTGVNLVGMLDLSANNADDNDGVECWPVDALPELLDEQVIDEVLFDVVNVEIDDYQPAIQVCKAEGVRTRLSNDLFPPHRVDLLRERQDSFPPRTFSKPPPDKPALLLKRVMDVTFAVTALVLLFPFVLFVAVLIRATSPGPVLFRQVRCGRNGRRFTFYKFRTMVVNAEQLRPALEQLNQKKIAFKMKDDPRITPVGRWLRRFSVDEWPQFWNILRGEMSLVGPRPPLPDEVAQYQRWQRRRLRTRPGLTCLWVLDGRDNVDFDHWVTRDLEYIDNWSFLLDLKILLLSVPCVLSGKGAH